MCTLLIINILLIVLKLALVEGDDYGELCYPTDDKNCFSPDYFLHWSGMKCRYGSRGGYGECWPWLFWWMELLYVAVGFPVLFGIIGLFCGTLCGDEPGIGCLIGVGIAWPCCSIPCLACFFITRYGTTIKCELCRRNMRSHNCKGNEALTHRQQCIEANRSQYDVIPDSPLYTCKKCETHLKLWPIHLLSKTSCIKCLTSMEDLMNMEDIVNNGSNMHICFTCAATGDFNTHHLCSGHGKEGTVTEVNWERLENLPLRPKPQTFQAQNHGDEGGPLIEDKASATAMLEPSATAAPQPLANALPPGWKVVTNPVTGEPYGLCDPSGVIKPLIDNNSSADGDIPPPLYDEAVPSAPSQYSAPSHYSASSQYSAPSPYSAPSQYSAPSPYSAPSQYSAPSPYSAPSENSWNQNWKNKTQRMMRQTSIEMDKMARKFEQ